MVTAADEAPKLEDVPAAEPAVETPDNAPAPSINDDDYEAAFNESVAKREAVKAGTAPPTPDPTQPEPAATDGPDPASQDPATPVAAPEDELLALVPADKRDALAQRLKAAADSEARAAKLEQDNRSMAGRMSAYQRRYEEAAGKRPAEVKKEATEAESADWTQFKEDYPDIAKAIESRVPATAGTTPEVAAVVEFVEQEKRTRFLHDAWDAVETVHAGWREKARSAEFQGWKKSSPTYEKLAASDDISDAIALFDLYDAHQSKAGVSPQPDPAQAAAAAQLAARRGAQVAGAQAPSHKASQPNQSVDLSDADQLFAFYADKSNARIKARHQ